VVKRREENVQLLKQKYEAGRESKAALLEVEAALALSKWEAAKDEHALSLAQRRLDKVLAWPLTAAVRVVPLPDLPKPAAAAPDWARALEGHPSLVSDSYDLDIGREDVVTAKSGFYPTSDLTSSLNKVGSTKWGLQDKNWQWTLGISFPFFTGGSTAAQWQSAKLALSRLEVDKASAKDALWVEAEDSFLSWSESAAFLDVADTTLKASESRAWLVKSQYATGQTTYFEWRNVEEQLVSVQKQMLAARRDLILAHARFEKAMGRGAP
jgi:outer membrane protein TolC